MPNITVANIEAQILGARGVELTAAGIVEDPSNEWANYSRQSAPSAGLVGLSPDGNVIVVSVAYGPLPSGARFPESPEQQTTADLSPLLIRQLEEIVPDVSPEEEIVPDISPKLEKHLSQFAQDRPGHDPVSSSTMSEVRKLVSWLCGQSNTVSAGISSNGMLSISASYPNHIRLYVEVERNGSAGAAVTRERRYANDVAGDTITDLLPEVILAAIREISSI